MKQINNNFIFFGAIHQDFVFELKNDLIKYRTNPIKHSESYGGVAHNVARVISKNENELKLTEREIEIILFLNDKKKPQNINILQKEVWSYSTDLETHTVETHIYRLRKKNK